MKTNRDWLAAVGSAVCFSNRWGVVAGFFHTAACGVCFVAGSLQLAAAMDFKQELFGPPPRIFAHIEDLNTGTGYVRINGVAMDLAAQPVWDFGDGTVVGSWFPAEHTYGSTSANHIVTVTGQFSDGTSGSTSVLVRFVQPALNPVSMPGNLLVTVPIADLALTSRMPGYGFSPALTHFDGSFFNPDLPRGTVEYLLTAAACLQHGFANGNVLVVDGGFRQYVLRDPGAGGMYSIWYSSPVAFAAADYAFQGTPQYSSFLHEMGHNLTLNFPAAFHYGGRIDGNANAIYSETLAQIFQHSTAYELINNAASYGLPADLVFDIHQSARGSIGLVRAAYERYCASGCNFQSWNNPATPEDETYDTFMTIACQFFRHAETAGQGYALPTRRLMHLLEVFNEDLRQQYDAQQDTAAGAEFRSTLLVTALSHAFQSDLRADFRALGFPVSDAVYDQLMHLATSAIPHLKANRGDLAAVIISWPWPSDGWELEWNDILSPNPSDWIVVPPPYETVGAECRFVENSPAGSRFFRLRRR